MTELTDLTADTAPTGDNLIYTVRDPSGTPVDRKMTVASLVIAVADLSGANYICVARGRSIRTAGNLTLNNTSWANVDTGLDITLTGVATGDWVEVAPSGTAQSATVAYFFDVVTVVSGSPVNSVGMDAAAPTSTTGEGVGGWVAPASASLSFGGPVTYILQAGDIHTTNQVTLRLRYRSASGTARTVSATTDRPFHFNASASAARVMADDPLELAGLGTLDLVGGTEPLLLASSEPEIEIPYTGSIPVLSDNVCVADAIVWDLTLVSDDRILTNTADLTNVATVPVTVHAQNVDSQFRYGKHAVPGTRTEDLWQLEEQGQALAEFLVGRDAEAYARIESATLHLHDPNQDLWTLGIDRRIGDSVRLLHEYPAAGGGVGLLDLIMVVETITHDVTPDGWTMTLATTRAVGNRTTERWDRSAFDWDDVDDANVWGY